MSSRTRNALASVNTEDLEHRSAQVDDEMIDQASIVAIFEPMHLTYLRKHHPEAAGRTASLARLARDLDPGDIATLSDRISDMELAEHEFAAWEEVIDPAGGEQPEFLEAVTQIEHLTDELLRRVHATSP